MQIAQKLRRLLTPYKRTVVAKAAGVTPQTLRNVLAGHKSPTLHTLRGVAHVLGVDLGWLIDDAREWPPVRVQPATDRKPVEETAAA
jgi:transcriptional regulator with XRE-family HTH domain